MEQSSKTFWVISTFILLAIIIVGGWLFVLNNKPVTQTTTKTTAKKVTATAVTTKTAPAAALKTFTSTVPAYTVKYPADWAFIKNSAGDSEKTDTGDNQTITFTKRGHVLSIDSPSSYEGAKCTYTGKESTETVDYGTAYTDITAGTLTFRRANEPIEGTDNLPTWTICQKDKDGNFVTSTIVDKITFTGPADWDKGSLAEMDAILKTLVAPTRSGYNF